jgi:hypothetical protein
MYVPIGFFACRDLLMAVIFPGLNIGAHKEAAEHFLSALAMQESIGSESSQQVWFTLRRAFLLMVCHLALVDCLLCAYENLH